MAAATIDVQACIDACNATVEATTRMLARHPGDKSMHDTLRLCLDTSDLCGTAIGMLQRGSPHASRICELLFDLCFTCARSCDRWSSDEARDCAVACRACADAARAVAAAA